MSSAGVKLIEVNEVDFADVAGAMERWGNFPASYMSHHGEQCCHLAREWFLSTDYSQLNAGAALTGPRWLRVKYKWGPSSWPVHWCEAAGEKTLDCGALAALAHELFLARGLKSYPAQLIQQYTTENARHWSMNWDGALVPAQWIKEDLIYHEACAVEVRDGEIRVWDPTASWWINPKQFGGYGGLLALRVFTSPEAPRTFNWGGQTISSNRWQKVERARADFA